MCGRRPCADPACTWSEAYRAQSEARAVLAMEFSARRPYLDLVEKKRGTAARQELEREIIRQYRA
ncbi:MAG TPA: hypothetical protein VNS29_15295 [Burkholderiaceae bacterium]|nr:hypothetical protein [Burkholderiaceae bacterium]